MVQGEAWIGLMLRLLTSMVALAALLLLSLHAMTPSVSASNDVSAKAAHTAHDAADRSAGEPVSACAVHCLATAFLPVPAVEVARTLRRVGESFEAPVRSAGLSPLPLGPPPKIVASL